MKELTSKDKKHVFGGKCTCMAQQFSDTKYKYIGIYADRDACAKAASKFFDEVCFIGEVKCFDKATGLLDE